NRQQFQTRVELHAATTAGSLASAAMGRCRDRAREAWLGSERYFIRSRLHALSGTKRAKLSESSRAHRRTDVEAGGNAECERSGAPRAISARVRRANRAIFRGQCCAAGLPAHARD